MIDKNACKESCCGCGVCVAICPMKAIVMQVDNEGFEYPMVDTSRCIHCNSCSRVCPMDNPADLSQITLLNTYAVKHKKAEIRNSSRSGGIFSALTDEILRRDGNIYGAVMEENFTVKHVRAVNADQRNRMRGSKYVQSSTVEIWKDVKKDLTDGKIILFSGTSCQIDALHRFLGSNPENLYCIDIVCHGVPSPKVLSQYIQWREQKAGSKCRRIDFRNKRDFGWADHIETLWMENGIRVDSKVYAQIFYSDYSIRPSCYDCPYKKIVHPSDISIADYWHIDQACPGFNDNKGVSLVLINSNKGQSLFDSILSEIEYRSTRIEDSMQKPFYESSKRPVDREVFWRLIEQSDFSALARQYGNYTPKEIINEKLYLPKAKIKKILKRD